MPYTSCIEDCSEAVRFFRNYKCVSEENNGEGSVGTVFVVTRDGEEFILKHQKKSVRSDAELKFLERVRGLPYVVQLTEEKTTNDDVFTIINFGHKGSLLDFLDEEEYFEDMMNIMKLFRKILEGVVALHEQNIVHADLKLENIVIDRNNDPFIIDFDLAVEMNSMERGRGSLKYTAPEVLDAMFTHKKVLFDEKIDTYSLGVILYALVTGCFAFDIEPTGENLSYKLKNMEVEFDKGFNKQIRDIILSCFVEREYRIGSHELLDKVTQFVLKPSAEKLDKEEVYTIRGQTQKMKRLSESQTRKTQRNAAPKLDRSTGSVQLEGAGSLSAIWILATVFGLSNLISF